MSPAERDELDSVVAQAQAEGYSQARIASTLGVTRDVIRASLRRLERKANAPAPLAKVEPVREASALDVANLLADIEDQIQVCTSTGDATGAQRWARTRQALLAGQRERVRADQAAREAERQTSTEDWTRLNDTQAATLIALTRKLNGEEPTSFDARALRALEGPRAPEPTCSACYLEPAHTPREWLCDACAEQVRALRARVPVAREGERALGAAPPPAP